MMTCPRCGLDNPDNAVSCECLYEFQLEDRHRDAGPPELNAILLSTTSTLEGFRTVQYLGIITAECAFGMNQLRDWFTGVRDIFGGRSGATQKVLRDARELCLSELKREAHRRGANAVVAVNLNYSEFSGGGKSMLFLVASGTAVLVQRAE